MIKINDDLYNKVEEITQAHDDRENGQISEDAMCSMIEDLVVAYESLQKKFKEYQEMVRDNYEEISPYRKYAVPESEI